LRALFLNYDIHFIENEVIIWMNTNFIDRCTLFTYLCTSCK